MVTARDVLQIQTSCSARIKNPMQHQVPRPQLLLSTVKYKIMLDNILLSVSQN